MRATDLARLAAQPAAIEPGPLPLPPLPAASAPQPAEAAAPQAPIATPDADGVLDVSRAGPPDPPERNPNPFRVRYHPPSPTRDVSVSVDSVLVPSDPRGACAVINGDLLSEGDRFEDMVVAAIGAEAIDLRRGPLLIRIPVRDRPTVLRLPR